MALALSIASVWVGHGVFSRPKYDPYASEAAALAAHAADRYENFRGLSPCEPWTYDFVVSAQDRLIAAGEPAPDMVVVIAPTFAEVEVVALSSSHLKSYRFGEQTGFDMPSSRWFSGTPTVISDTPLESSEYFRLYSPFARHVKYAMTARQLGFDGTSFYFGLGRSECAMAWSPHTGQAGLMSQILYEASQPSPSRKKLLELAGQIDRLDAAH
jgi:hypothetical protein